MLLRISTDNAMKLLMWTTDAKSMDTHQNEKQDKVEESSSEALESHRTLTSEPGDLPGSYNETRVVLLPVEPYLLHVYWEVTPVELEKAKHQLFDEHGQSQAILRCYDVTNIVYDGMNAHGFFDVYIDLLSKSRYVHLWSPEKSYFVELGFKTEDGRFYPIARSNIAQIPPDWPAPKSDEHYMHVAGDYDLLQTVPAPIDVKPPDSLTLPKASRAELELPSAAERDRHCETRSPFAAEENSLGAEVHKEKGHPKEGCLDLTEMSEKRFVSGLSSNR
jgi:hypothetical protein